MATKLIQPVTGSSLTPMQLRANAFIARMNVLYTGQGVLFNQLADFLYGNANPQAAFDAFGTGAGDLFAAANAYAAEVLAYEGVVVPSPIPPGASVVINSDGTVTYTPPPTGD